MAAPDAKPFPRRHNPDGSHDSICPECFRTVARSKTESDLDAQEKLHVCAPSSLQKLRRGTVEPAADPDRKSS
jgi:hypothetical protein